MIKTIPSFKFIILLCLVFVFGSLSLMANDIDIAVTVPEIPPENPVLNFSINKDKIILGENIQLTWSSENTSSCTASGDWGGNKALSDSEFITPNSIGSKTFQLTCSGVGGSISKNLNLDVVSEPKTISEEIPVTPTPEKKPIPFFPSLPGNGDNGDTSDTKERIKIIIYTEKERVVADGSDYAKITGQVKNENGKNLDGVNVKLISNQENDIISPISYFSDKDGFIHFNIKSKEDHVSTIKAILVQSDINYSSNSIIIKFEKPSLLEGNEILKNILSEIDDFRNNQEIKNISQDIVVPILGATAIVTSYLVLVSLFKSLNDILPLLNYFITSILQLFGIRRKPRRWGIVYDSKTKKPIQLAMVRLFEKNTGRIVQTSVTDGGGRFGFSLVSGDYYISVSKPFYIFPSRFLKGLKKDWKYNLLYFGKTFRASNNRIINFSIPLDPINLKKKITIGDRLKSILEMISTPVLFFGLVLSIFILWINPVWFNLAILLLYVLLLVLKSIFLKTPLIPIGIVFDANSRRPIAGLSVNIFDSKYKKLLSTKVTDKRGRFNLLLPEGFYYIRISSYKYRLSNKKEVSKKEYSGEIINIKENQEFQFKIPLVRM